MPDEYPVLLFEDQRKWRAWLRVNHNRSTGIWMRLAKKNSGAVSISYSEAVEEALCQGWIDGQKKSGDADTWLQKFTPRRRKSVWSKINRDKALALIASNRMQAAGSAAVQSAREDGRWQSAYDPQSSIEVPADFAKLLAGNPHASAFFATVNSVNRYAVLHRIQTAKTPATRVARMKKFIAMLAEHRLIYS